MQTYYCLFLLITAHLVADFPLQNNYLATHKKHSTLLILLHTLIHSAVTYTILWNYNPLFFAITVFVLHTSIDFGKKLLYRQCKDSLKIFAYDQLAHIISLFGLFQLHYFLIEQNILPRVLSPYNKKLSMALLLLDALILTTSVSGHIIGYITENFVKHNKLKISGLKNGGRWIGNLERTLIFFLILFNMSSVVGLIATAKSILRFGEVKKDWKIAEYVLIGTLISFLPAIVIGYLTSWVLYATFPPEEFKQLFHFFR